VRPLLVAALIAGTAHADPEVWPDGTHLQQHETDPPDDPPMPEFAARTAFTLLRVGADGAARCETWTTQSGSDPNHGHLVHDALSIDFHSAGIRLDVCGYRALVHDEGSGSELDVDGTRWFRTPRGCAAAIAKHRNVAVDFHDCLDDPAPSAKAVAATRARFSAFLEHGGAMTVRDDGACPVARAIPRPDPPSELVIDYPDRVRSLDYSYDAGSAHLSVINDETRSKGSDFTGQYGCVCVDDYDPTFGDGTIETLDVTFFTTDAACRAAVAAAARRASWLPSPAP
jgi:hypothetical protein